MISSFSVSDILNRIYLVLPSKFSRETGTELYALLYGLGEALKINTDQIDELVIDTNLATATGAYLDAYITDLIDLGRKEGESDDDYRNRFYYNTFVYNCSKDGIKAISINVVGNEPYGMFTDSRRGAYLDSRYYYDDDMYMSEYGDSDSSAFIAYIEFGRKPRAEIFDELCKTIAATKAAGIKIYLKYPVDNDLEVDPDELDEGSFERTVLA